MQSKMDARDRSGLQVDQTSCGFCEITNGRSDNAADQVLAQSESFVVVASTGALLPGWLLVVPREHTLNLAKLYLDPELATLRVAVAEAIAQAYPHAEVRMFEHGSAAPMSLVGCGVDHAHLHMVPVADSLASHFKGQWERLRLSELPSYVRGAEYLLYSDAPLDSDPECLLTLPHEPQSQFFRRLVATAVGRPADFDYRVHPYLDNVERTQASRPLRRALSGAGRRSRRASSEELALVSS